MLLVTFLLAIVTLGGQCLEMQGRGGKILKILQKYSLSYQGVKNYSLGIPNALEFERAVEQYRILLKNLDAERVLELR